MNKTKQAKPAGGKKWRRVENSIIFETSTGRLKLPIDVKVSVLRKMKNAGGEDGDDLDAFLALLDGLGDQTIQEQVDNLGTFEVIQLVEQYFEQFNRFMAEAAGVGE